ncbi:MAG: hypothetical protein M3020_02635 [Myxococcota bacterium]|nr:hypothetical protein [Myxococcota bacterium]
MTDPPFSGFLRRSLDVLSREAPRAAGALCELLSKIRLCVSVDGERLSLVVARGRLGVYPVQRLGDTFLATRRATLVDLLEGRRSLLDAVLDDSVELRGAVDDLLVVDQALLTYLHGAVRSQSFPELLREFSMSADVASAKGPLSNRRLNDERRKTDSEQRAG